MKKTIHYFLFILSLISVFGITNNTYAANEIRVYVDNGTINFGTSPIIKNERTMVPVRQIFESLGYTVQWNSFSKTIIGKKNNNILTMEVGSSTAYKNGNAIALESPPEIINSNTMVPLRFIAESTGADVKWNPSARVVNVTSSSKLKESPSIEDSIVMIQGSNIQGSGTVLSKDGMIATNFHVIEKGTPLKIVFQDKKEYQGDITVLGYDIAKDLAVIKINAVNLRAVSLGDSDKITVGDDVMAIGFPNDSQNKVTRGKILSFTDSIISSSAVIGQGSSGGGLFNQSKQLIGITSMNNGFQQYLSISVNLLKKISTGEKIPLSEIKNIKIKPSQVKNPTVSFKGNTAYLSWDPVYGSDYYHIYKSSSLNGEYVPVINPKNNSTHWYWGYPHSFGVSVNSGTKTYFKIASVRDGAVSQLSQPLEISLGS